MIILSEFGRRACLFLLEDTVEIAEVVEPALIGYFRDGPSRVDQHARSISQPYVDDVFRQVASRVQLEETAEGTGAHAGDVGQGR